MQDPAISCMLPQKFSRGLQSHVRGLAEPAGSEWILLAQVCFSHLGSARAILHQWTLSTPDLLLLKMGAWKVVLSINNHTQMINPFSYWIGVVVTEPPCDL